MVWMRTLGLPVLSGVVVDGWSHDSAAAVNKFCDRNDFSSVLLRIDKRHDRWTRRRGGYILPQPAIPDTLGELKREGMLALLLERRARTVTCIASRVSRSRNNRK